jgi:hypothetical protein
MFQHASSTAIYWGKVEALEGGFFVRKTLRNKKNTTKATKDKRRKLQCEPSFDRPRDTGVEHHSLLT